MLLLHGEREHAVVQQVVVGRSVVKMAVALIAPSIRNSTALFDIIANGAERLEEIVVEAVA